MQATIPGCWKIPLFLWFHLLIQMNGHETWWSVLLLLVYVDGVLVQVSDETDRVWSEALFALTCCCNMQ
jgi:uncharacterized membrane protein